MVGGRVFSLNRCCYCLFRCTCPQHPSPLLRGWCLFRPLHVFLLLEPPRIALATRIKKDGGENREMQKEEETRAHDERAAGIQGNRF